MKYVSAAKPTQYADQLHEIQQEIKKLEKRLKELGTEELQLQRFLLKAYGESFTYSSKDGYQKVVKIGHVERMILDQERVRKMLKAKTPYRLSEWDTVKVDWVYSKK